MKLKITINEAVNIHEGLKSLLDEDISTVTAFSIQRNYNELGEEVSAYNEVRVRTAKKYEDYIEDGRIVDEEKRKEFSKEIQEILDQEVEVNVRMIPLLDLGDKAKPRTLGLIEKIIEEEKDNENNSNGN